MDEARRFVAEHMQSPPMPQLDKPHRVLHEENVVAGAKLTTTMNIDDMEQLLPVVSVIDFTGKVVRVAPLPSADERCTNPRQETARINCMLVFGHTKAVQISGAPSRDAALNSLHMMRFYLGQLGVHTRFEQFKLDNVVASVRFPYRLKLPEIEQQEGSTVLWRPAIFPGALLVDRHGNVVVIFDTGSGNVVGLDSVEHLPELDAELSRMVAPFRDDSPPDASQRSVGRCVRRRLADATADFARHLREVVAKQPLTVETVKAVYTQTMPTLVAPPPAAARTDDAPLPGGRKRTLANDASGKPAAVAVNATNLGVIMLDEADDDDDASSDDSDWLGRNLMISCMDE
jgi:TATA-box binding protein (TBP) (component of TFIID and TFIIIB)